MYLQEIEIHNWRGLTHQHLKLTPGINIIHGPNESGKSSLRQAIWAALTKNPTSKAKDALSARTWASSSNPKVRVDFHLDGDDWSVQKTFLSTVGSRLLKGGRLLASDKAVHDHLEQLLSKAVWMGSLWGEQGDMALVQVPRALRGQLVAQEVVSPGMLWLEDQLKRKEAEFWTPKGRPKKPLQDMRDRAMAAEESADEAADELESSNRISEEIASLRDELALASAEEKELSETLQTKREQVGAWDRHRAATAQWKARVLAVQSQVDWLARFDRLAGQVAARFQERTEFQARLVALTQGMLPEPSRKPVSYTHLTLPTSDLV